MYFILDNSDITDSSDKYSKNLDFFSLFLVNQPGTPTTTATPSQRIESSEESFNEAFSTLIFTLLTQVYQILAFGCTDILARIYECVNSSWLINLAASSNRLILSSDYHFSTSTFELRIFLVLVNLLLILGTSVLLLWCLLRNKINFYYHKGKILTLLL